MNLVSKFQKIVASVATVALALTVVAAPANAAWYDVYVSALEGAEIVDGNFNPAADTTRLGFVSTLVKAAGLSASDTDAGFADVNNGLINAAVEAGIVDGPVASKDNKFFPNDNISRAAVTKVVLEAMGIDVASYQAATQFEDLIANEWYVPYVTAAYNLSIVDGVNSSSKTFEPAGNIVDAAMAKITTLAVIVAQDAASYERFDDGSSAFSVFEDSEIATQVAAIANKGTETETETETEEEEPTVVVGASDGSLEVSLSAATASSSNIPYNVQGVAYTSVDLTANGDDVTISSITVSRTGLGDNDDFDKVWIEIDGERVSSKKSINSDDIAVITLQNVVVEAGETVTAVVMASMSAIVGTSVQSGHTNAIQIISADAVATNAESVVGDFPLIGNKMGIADYAVVKALFNIEDTSANNVAVGDLAKELARFSVKADGTKDITLQSIRFKNIGSAELIDTVEALFLETSGSKVAEATINGDYATFTFDNYVIDKGDSTVFRIKADIIAQEAGNNTIQFKLDDKEDLVAIETDTKYAAASVSNYVWDGSNSNYTNATGTSYTAVLGAITSPVTVDTDGVDNADASDDSYYTSANLSATNTDFAVSVKKDTTSAGSDADAYLDAEDNAATLILATLGAGSSTVSKDTSSPTNTSVSSNTDGIEILVAKVVIDQEINADAITVTEHGTIDITNLENIKLYVNGVLVDSVDPSTNSGSMTFDSSFTLKSGTNTIRVVTDIKDTTGLNGNTIQFKITGSSAFEAAEYTSNGDTATIAGTATSSIFTVADTTASMTRNDGLTGETVIAGATEINFVKFVVNATDGDVRINSIDVTGAFTDNNAGDALVASDITGMKLMMNGAQVGNTEDLNASFTGLDIVITENTQASFVVTGDLSSGAADTDAVVFTVAMDAEDKNNDSVTISNITSTTFTVATQGSLTVATDGDTPDTELLVANSSDVEVAKFKFTAQDDDIDVTDLVLKTGNTDMDARIASLKLYVGGELLIEKTTTSGTASFDIPSNAFIIAKNTNAVLTVKADFNAITKAVETGETFTITLDDVQSNSRATGNALTTIATDYSADAMYIVKTRPTLTTQTLSSTKLVNGEQTLYKVSVAADASEDVEVANIVFDVIQSGVTLSGFKLFVNGSEVNASNYVADTSEPSIGFALKAGNEETISAGTSKVFELKATAAAVISDDYVTVKMIEDSAIKTADVVTLVKAAASNAGAAAWEAGDVVTTIINGTSVAYTVTAPDVAADDTVLFTAIKAALDANTTVAALVNVVVTDANTLTLTADNAGTVITASSSITTNVSLAADTITATNDTTNNFVWSDNAGSPHTRSTTDWFNGKEVNGLDTASTTLQN